MIYISYLLLYFIVVQLTNLYNHLFETAPLLNNANKERKLLFPKNTIYFKKHEKYNNEIVIITMKSRWSQERINKEIEKGTKFIIKSDNYQSIRAKYNINKTGFDIPNQLLNTSKLLEIWGKMTTEHGTNILKNIINKVDVFSYPKPVNLIKYFIHCYKNKNAVVLDFFAGSGTTGHAILDLNQEDGGNRQFILVTNNESNIAIDVTYERLHRILKGKGTKNETNFAWLNKNQVFKNDNLNVFIIKPYSVMPIINDKKNNSIKYLKKLASTQLKKLNPKLNLYDDKVLYHLRKLYPLKKD